MWKAKPSDSPPAEPGKDFIRAMVDEHVRKGRFGGRVVTRFPPEPNGFLHIGHAMAICLDFDIAAEFGGVCHLRLDDTNPTGERPEYVEAIKRDIRWLGYDWGQNEFYASDYFEQLYGWAEQLIEAGRAYVDDQSAEEIRAMRGTLTEPGEPSPFRDRTRAENLDLFRRMRDGEFEEGERVLRARIDMAAPNVNMRDPVMYRIVRQPHYRTGDRWRIYPSYDWAHGQSDSIEGVTHSLCSLEFEDHRPLYDWFLEQLDVHHPRQIEFARLNVSHTVTSKRTLKRLVDEGHVAGWDDPRMPTLSGLRRRGYPPEAIREFCAGVGVAKRERIIEVARLEHHVRHVLNRTAPRRMAVLNPLRMVIENWPADSVDDLTAINNPEDASAGARSVPFSGVLYIERDDFMESPPRKFYRLSPGREVRLRYAYFVTCTGVVKDPDTGEVVEVRCRYDPETRGGDAPDGRKVKATLHWVSAEHSIAAQARLYDHLFSVEDPGALDSRALVDALNPDSLRIAEGCRLEPSLIEAQPGEVFQFERLGYFCADADSRPEARVFNRTATLRDSWRKTAARVG